MLKWIKKNKKYIMILMFLVSIINIIGGNSVYALINPDSPEAEQENFLQDVIGTILGGGLGILGVPFAGLVNAVNVIIFMLIYTIFVAGELTSFNMFPSVDNIVFNRMAFFDPNFINPANSDYSKIHAIQGVIAGLYYSFVVIAVAVMAIAAMVIGIKLAVSTVAAEKAKYKEAIGQWIFGIVMLFVIHIIMAAIFTVNEKIVEFASEQAGDISFKFSGIEVIPFTGKKIYSVIKGIEDFFNTNVITDITTITVDGMYGFYIRLILKSIGGDFTSAFMCAIILGESVALIVTYMKRLFYCIFLGIMAPLVVAVDTISRSMG